MNTAQKNKLKHWWKTTNSAFVVKNVLAAIVIFFVLLSILLACLRSYTEHGIEVDVPDVTGLYLIEAEPLASAVGLRLIVVDSTYSKKVPLGAIVEQNPPADSHAKHDRALYVITNSKTKRMLPIPNLRDISYRQAEATLRSLGLEVRDVRYEPSEFKDLVLDVLIGERSIEEGERIAEGTGVILVVGRGRGTESVVVPNLHGFTLVEARSQLLSQYLTVGVVDYDVEPTEEDQNKYVVYQQYPEAGTVLQEGSRVDFSLSKDIEKAIISDNSATQEEDFF